MPLHRSRHTWTSSNAGPTPGSFPTTATPSAFICTSDQTRNPAQGATMQAYDYEALIYDGAVYCVGCLPDGVNEESTDVAPIFAASECDSYPVCDACGREHDYVSLTEYGQRQRYLRCESESIRQLREQHHGELPTFAWPGGYRWLYQTTHGDTLCAPCAHAHADEQDPI